jgi:hypothetical protein
MTDDEPRHGEEPIWKPDMTRAEADRWTAGSDYPSPVYHVTTVEAAASIRRHGFQLGRRSGGRAWGDGIYAAVDDATRRFYLDQLGARGVALELRVRVKRVLRLRINQSVHTQPFWQLMLAVLDGMARFLEARRRGAALARRAAAD